MLVSGFRLKSFEVETAHWGLVEYRVESLVQDLFGGLVLTTSGKRVGYIRKGQWGAWWETDARRTQEPAEPEAPVKNVDGFDEPPPNRQTYRGPFEPRPKPALP